MHALHVPFAALATMALGLAQTTGVPGINDYTINGVGSGSTSCTTQCFNTPVNLSLDVSTAPGNFVIYVWSFCPCFGGFVCGGPNACLPAIPFSACGSTTNQSLDLQLGCVLTTFGPVQANTAGLANLVLPFPTLSLPPCSFPMATQAVILDLCGAGISILPGPFVFSQSYNVLFG
jgi:hypothetical protein